MSKIIKQQKICVICHLYYQYMWDEIKEYLKNLEQVTPFDLYITCQENNEILFNDIKNSFNENVRTNIELIEATKGADIYPFIETINKINLDDYDLVYKIHTKQNVPNLKVKFPKHMKTDIYIGEQMWRNFLINAILGKHNVKKILEKFQKDAQIGSAGFYPLQVMIKTICNGYYLNEHPKGKQISKDLKFPNRKDCKFYGGTIFVIRANLLKCIQNVFNKEDFLIAGDEKFSPSAYFLEGLFGYIVKAQGYQYYSTYNKTHKIILQLLSHHDLIPLFRCYVNNFIFKREVIGDINA